LSSSESIKWRGSYGTKRFASSSRVDVRLGWHSFEDVESSLVGENLLSKRRDEWSMGTNVFASAVPRSFYGKIAVRWP
jgi:hypothetical protein